MERFNLSTDVPDQVQGTELFRYVFVALCFIPCAILILVGNTFVLLAYKRDKRIRENTTNAYIFNLALADILVGVVMVIYAPTFFASGTWRLGGLCCIVLWVLDYTATDMSVITIVIISIDRYMMVHNALRYRSRQSHKKVAIICSISWLACLAVHASLAFTYAIRSGFLQAQDRIAVCDLGYGKNLVVLVMMFMVELLLPAVCVFSLNLTVYFHLKRRSNNYLQNRPSQDHRSHAVPLDDGLSRTTSRGNDDMRVHQSSSGSHHQKAARFLALLLAVFIICWLPYYIEDCYTFVHSSGVHNETLNKVVSFILWMNSAINPFLYAYNNVFFRKNFMQFLRCK